MKRHIAPLQLPFIVLLQEQHTDAPNGGASFGKIPAISVLRLISAFTRSRGFVDAIYSRCAFGKRMNASTLKVARPLQARKTQIRVGIGSWASRTQLL